jgi:hypothetical protein
MACLFFTVLCLAGFVDASHKEITLDHKIAREFLEKVESEHFFSLSVLKHMDLIDELRFLFFIARKAEHIEFIKRLLTHLNDKQISFFITIKDEDIEFFVSRSADIGFELLKSVEGKLFCHTVLKAAADIGNNGLVEAAVSVNPDSLIEESVPDGTVRTESKEAPYVSSEDSPEGLESYENAKTWKFYNLKFLSSMKERFPEFDFSRDKSLLLRKYFSSVIFDGFRIQSGLA